MEFFFQNVFWTIALDVKSKRIIEYKIGIKRIDNDTLILRVFFGKVYDVCMLYNIIYVQFVLRAAITYTHLPLMNWIHTQGT